VRYSSQSDVAVYAALSGDPPDRKRTTSRGSCTLAFQRVSVGPSVWYRTRVRVTRERGTTHVSTMVVDIIPCSPIGKNPWATTVHVQNDVYIDL